MRALATSLLATSPSQTHENSDWSETVRGTPGPAQLLDLSATTLRVNEGATGDYTLRLATEPAGNTTVTVTVPPKTDVSVSPTSLTFTTTSWNTAQTVTVMAAEDDDEINDPVVTLTHAVSGVSYGAVEVTITENDGAVPTFSVTGPPSVGEGEGKATYTVTLSAEPDSDVTVKYATADGRATAGSDYTAASGTLTFTAMDWSTAQTVDVIILDDMVDDEIFELDEGFTFTLSEPAPGSVLPKSPWVTTTITDNDTRGVTLSPEILTVQEGDSGIYTVKLDTQPTGDVTVTVNGATGDVSVDTSTDTGNQNTLTFTDSNWNTAQTVTVAAAEDDDAVADDEVTLMHAVSGGDYGGGDYRPATAGSVAVTIIEKDVATFSVTGPPRVGEGDGTATYRVTLSAEPDSDVTVDYATADDTATAGSDYTAESGTLTFTTTSWDTAQTVNVAITDDSVDDDDEIFTFTLSDAGTGSALSASASSVTTTITDDDDPEVTVSFGAGSYIVAEGSTISVTVSLSAAPKRSVTIPLTTANGAGATSGDYSGVPASVTFASSDDLKTVVFASTSDAVDEDDETVTLGFGTPLPAGVTAVAGTESTQAVVTITDDDTALLSVSGPTSATVAEDAGTATYSVSLSLQPIVDVMVDYATADGTATATAGSDYTATSGTLTFTPDNWNTAQTVAVSITDDAVVESDETFTFALSNPVNAPLLSTATSVETTITNDDTRGVTLSESSLTVLEGATDTYTVKLDTQPTGDVTVTVNGAAGDVSVDTSTDTGNQNTLTFTDSNWDTAQTVTVSAAEDDDAASDPTVTLTHAVTGADYGSVTAGSVAVTITDKDAATFSVTGPATAAVAEDAGMATYTVSLSDEPGSDVTVDYATSDGTATAGSDYTATSGTLTFTTTNWDTAQTVNVAITNDSVDESNETFTFTLSNAGSGSVLSTTSASVTTTITDDDTALLSVSGPTSATVAEDAGTATYSVSLSLQPIVDVMVDYATADGTATATAGSDYTEASGTLTFTPDNWNTAQTVAVSITDDAVVESDETFTFALSNPVNAPLLSTATSVETTITNDDTRGVMLSESSLMVLEGATGTYTVVLDSEPTGNVTLTVGGTESTDVTVDTSPETGNQTTLTFTSATWNTAQTVTVSAATDADAANDAVVTLTHAVTGADYGSVTAGSVEVTITEKDAATFSVTGPATAAVAEDAGMATYTVSLSAEPGSDVTVDYATADDTATAGSDYTEASGTLTFTTTNWDTAQTVNVAITNDSVDESNETFTFTLSNAGSGSVLSTTSASVETTITDNDTRGVMLSESSLTVLEGATGTYTVVLDSEPTGDVTVTVNGAAGDVSVDTSTDTGNQNTLTFTDSNWNTAQTVTVSAAEDTDKDIDPTVTLTHAVTGADYGSVMAGSVEVTITDKDAATFSVTGPATVAEDAGMATYTVLLSAEPGSDVTVDYATADDTATAGSDYTEASGTLTFTTTNWDTAQTVNVAITNDSVDESNETFTFTLSNAGSGSVLSTTSASVETTITDNDTRGVMLSAETLTVKEGESGIYTVVLDSEPTGDVTVTVNGATGDVSVDTSLETGTQTTLTFTSTTWNTAQTVTVSAAEDDDAVADDEVTLTHAVTGADYGSVMADSVEVTITEKDAPGASADQGRQMWLAHFSRTTTELALGGVTQRLVATRTPGPRVVLAGQALDGGRWSEAGTGGPFSDSFAAFGRAGEEAGVPDERTMTVGEALAASSFTMTGEADETGAGVALWGQVMQSHFESREGATDVDGKATTGLLGVDYGDESRLGGVALAWSDSEGGYRGSDAGSSGDVEASLSAVIPYGSLQVAERLDVWGALGFGSGTMTVTPEGGSAIEADIDWRMMSAGVRSELMGLGSGPAVALVSDALWSRTGSSRVEASESRSGLAASESDATRLRLGVEGRWDVPLEEGGSLVPRVEAGGRHDGGDVGSGLGVELGGGVTWTVPRLGLSLDVAGRTLFVHESEGRREHDISVTVDYDARPGSARGLSLSVRQETGGQSEGGLDALFASGPLDERTAGEAEGGWSAEAAYGVPVFGGRFTASPTVGVGFVGESRDYSLGWRLAPASESDVAELSLGVEATRRESGEAVPEQSVGLELGVRW